MPWTDETKAGPWGAPAGGEAGAAGGKPGGEGKPADRPPDPGSKGPWGGDPAPGPQRPSSPPSPRPSPPRRPGRPPEDHRGPHLEQLIAQLRTRAQALFGVATSRELSNRLVLLALGGALAGWAMTGLYVVEPEERGVVTRFGAYVGSEAEGPHYHLPWPIEDVRTVSVARLTSMDVGGPGSSTESRMLTADRNLVDLGFVVQYKIASAPDYLFRVSDPEGAIRMIAQSAMREVVGRTQLSAVLTSGRAQVQQQAAELMQQLLDKYHAGVSVAQVQITSAEPPPEVLAAARDADMARQEAQTAVNEARTYQAQKLSEAKGDAARTIQQAQGYSEQVAREAEGSAARFDEVYEAYKQAPAVTRERLYLETMERVLSRSNKIIVDAKGAPIVLPPDSLRSQPGPAAPSPAPTPRAAAQPSTAPQTSGGR